MLSTAVCIPSCVKCAGPRCNRQRPVLTACPTPPPCPHSLFLAQPVPVTPQVTDAPATKDIFPVVHSGAVSPPPPQVREVGSLQAPHVTDLYPNSCRIRARIPRTLNVKNLITHIHIHIYAYTYHLNMSIYTKNICICSNAGTYFKYLFIHEGTCVCKFAVHLIAFSVYVTQSLRALSNDISTDISMI